MYHLCFFTRSFMVRPYICLLFTLSLFLCMVWESTLSDSCACSCSVFPTPSIAEAVFPTLYSLALCSRWINHISIIYFWALYSAPLTCVSGFLPVPCCFDYCSFIVWFEIREHDPPGLSYFFSKLFSLFRVFCVSIQILKLFVLVLFKNVTDILIGIELNL